MPKRMLIVDDSASLRTVAKLALQRAGYEMLKAGGGVQALAQLATSGKVNLILSDLNMPNMDGITFVKQVKQDPQHRFTPVMLLTTKALESKKDQGRAVGARAWLVKPFNPPQLLDAVSKLASP